MTRYNDKDKIIAHYEFVSPYYFSLWGQHLHHGYWIRGDETKEKAQVQLIEHLAQSADIRPGRRILDVGCGFGGTSVYLAKAYKAAVTGITISPIQVEMAKKAAAHERAQAKFLLMDAEEMKFDHLFDVVWSVESISHYRDTERFFASAVRLMNSNGTMAIIDWFKKENLSASQHRKFLHSIEKGMFVELRTMGEYEAQMKSNGLSVIRSEIMNDHCAKTWDIGLGIIKNKQLWALAARNGLGLVTFLKAFRAMRAGFRSGNFVYGMIVGKKV